MKYTRDGMPVIERMVHTSELTETGDGRVFVTMELTEEEVEELIDYSLDEIADFLLHDCSKRKGFTHLAALMQSEEGLYDAAIATTSGEIMLMLNDNIERIVELAVRKAQDMIAAEKMEKEEGHHVRQ